MNTEVTVFADGFSGGTLCIVNTLVHLKRNDLVLHLFCLIEDGFHYCDTAQRRLDAFLAARSFASILIAKYTDWILMQRIFDLVCDSYLRAKINKCWDDETHWPLRSISLEAANKRDQCVRPFIVM